MANSDAKSSKKRNWPLLAMWGIYVLVVVVLLLSVSNRSAKQKPANPDLGKKKATMGIDWPNEKIVATVPAKPVGLWTLAAEYVSGPALIKITVPEGQSWRYGPKNECLPDGDPSAVLRPDKCLSKDAPTGSLIAKIGGSKAGIKDGTVYLVGSFVILELDDKVRGPLYLSINDEPSGMENNSGELRVEVLVKPVEAAGK